MIVWMVALSAAAAPACRSVDGNWVRMADLAASDARFSGAEASQTVALAPQPGAKRVFYAGELKRIADANGIETNAPFGRLCYERKMRRPDALEIAEAIRAWAPAGAKIEIVEQSQFSVPDGQLVFPRPRAAQTSADGVVLLRGYVDFGRGQHFPLWAKVRMEGKMTRVVAGTAIRAGQEIDASQLRIEEHAGPIDTAGFASTVEQVSGRAARKDIAPGGGILLAFLEPPKQVHAGAIVHVEVQSGAARLAFEGKAENSGRTGETISIRNPSSGRSFPARITGENAVLVSPQGLHLKGSVKP